MSPLIIDIAIVVASLALFGACFEAALLATRPGRPRPTAPTPDLGDEPPAVVNLLGNGWRLNEDAVEATLLDLAARRYLELRQPGSDPRQTTVHLRPAAAALPGALTRYEQRVLDRVRGLAVDGVVPVSALTFRNEDQEREWERRFRAEVIADAHTRGLSRRRFGAPVITLLEVAAAISALGLTAAVAHWESWAVVDDDSRGMWVMVGIVAFVVLGATAAGVTGERDTDAGLATATRWLGVQEWLRGHEEFADLPPASVMAWDRYLAYGAALGVTRNASEILDLGMADRSRVWSSYGGGWRRVRVRYPRRGSRYGLTGGKVLSGALIRVAVGTGLLWLYAKFLPLLDLPNFFGPDTPDELELVERLTGYLLLAGGILLIARGGYWLLRGTIDIVSTRGITGQVLWLQVWLSQRSGSSGPVVTTLHYLAIDDGSGDRTTAWGLPPELAADVVAGDTVTVRVRPWTRRVLQLTVAARGSGYRLAEAQVREDRADSPRIQWQPLPALDAATLLTAAEVGQALGMSVRQLPPTPTPLVSMATFADEQGKPVLMVQVTGGGPARWIWRAHAMRGTALPGLGVDASGRGGQVAARVGELTVVLLLMHGGKRAEPALPRLLRQAVARIPTNRPAALPNPD